MKDLSKRAKEITDPAEARRVFELLKNRHATSFWDFDAVGEDGPIRLYKAVPEKAWMNDDGNMDGHYIDIRTEIKLAH